MKYTHKGQIIEGRRGNWVCLLEDGMYTYSIIEYKGSTIKEVKRQIDQYYERINKAYRSLE